LSVSPPESTAGALRALFSPTTAGIGPDAPRVRVVPLLLIALLLALQVWARYRWDFLAHKDWQWLHMLIGWGVCALVIGVFHGFAALARAITRRSVFIVSLAFAVLCIFWYTGRSDSFHRYFSDFKADPGSVLVIAPFMWFAANATFWRLVVPFAAARLTLGLPPTAMGLPVGKAPVDPALPPAARRSLPWLYLLLFLGVLPFVVLVADTPNFLAKYPLSRDMVDADGTIPWSHLLAFEIFYLFIFISGESFWRGFLTFGLERDLGLYALPVMIVPYVTSHFGKPFAETLGAIAAGFVLGFLALKHRSVWYGIALHYGIALSMDLLAIHHHGYTLR
jgi:membrane protease YdiL (CAAX protease family)